MRRDPLRFRGPAARYLAPALLAVSLFFSGPHVGLAQDAAAVSGELRQMYEEDQADRRFTAPPTPEKWQEISARDAARRARVRELLREDALSGAADFYHAAMVLQHGETSEDILLAHILATAAAFAGDERGRWLSAASLDRYLHRTRMPQRLGTQYVRAGADDPFDFDPDAPWSQGPYVRWLPDTVRKIYGVRPLEEQEERVRSMGP